MKKILYVECFIIVVMALSTVSDAQESQTLDKDALQAMLALNYCHMSLVKILAYEDRVVLDEEYNNIINNINLTAIQDEEIIIVLQNLMDTLTAYKLAEGDKNILVKEYNKRVTEASYAPFNLAFKDVATNEDVKKFAIDAMTTLPKKLFQNVLNNTVEGLIKGGSIGGGAGLIRGIFLTSSSGPGIGFLTMDSLASMGSSYQHYRSNIEDYRDKLDRDIWQLEKTTIQTVNETRKTFLQVYWKLMQKYNIPDRFRLTEKQLQQAVGVFKEQDLEKKLRRLKTMEQDFSVFPPFWYEFAQTFQKVGEIEQALRIYEKVEQEHIPFFREDHEFSSALMNKVVLVQAIQKTQPELLDRLELTVDIPKDLNLITANSPDDWRKNLFVALQYTELKEYETARALLMKNIDTNQEASLNSRLLGEIYALSNDEERLTQLITKMCHDDAIRYQDTLYLIGMARDGKLLRETMDTFVKPSFSEIQFDVESQYLGLGKDTIRISIPVIWLRDDPEDFIPSLKFLEEEEDFSPIEKAQNDKEKNVQFVFKDVINKDEFIEKREQKTMVVKLTDIAQSVVLLLDVNVKDVEVEDTLLDKPGKVVGKTTKYVKNVFSKDKDSETREETLSKTKSVIDFTLKEIATAAGVCYRLDDDGLERLSECNFSVEM